MIQSTSRRRLAALTIIFVTAAIASVRAQPEVERSPDDRRLPIEEFGEPGPGVARENPDEGEGVDPPPVTSGIPFAFGPLQTRSIDSLSLLFPEPTLERAATVEDGHLRLSTLMQYSALETNNGTIGGYRGAFDHEFLRLEFSAAYGLRDDLELRVTLPVHYSPLGFLDGFIDDFHDVTGLGAVHDDPPAYVDTLQFRGREFHSVEQNGLSLGDVPLGVKFAVLNDGSDPFGLALRAGIELPTGRVGAGFGSGKVDGTVGAVVEKTVSQFTFYGALDGTFQDTPSRFRRAGVELHPAILNSAFGIEWRPIDWLAFHFQANYGGAHVRHGAGEILGRDRVGLVIGGTVGGERVRVRLGLGENLYSGLVPDVTFIAGLEIDLD